LPCRPHGRASISNFIYRALDLQGRHARKGQLRSSRPRFDSWMCVTSSLPFHGS
jgi:hypothetical protein